MLHCALKLCPGLQGGQRSKQNRLLPCSATVFAMIPVKRFAVTTVPAVSLLPLHSWFSVVLDPPMFVPESRFPFCVAYWDSHTDRPDSPLGTSAAWLLCTALIICERNKGITKARMLISVRPAVKSRGCASHCVLSVWLLPRDCPADAGVLGSFWFLPFSLL